MYELQGLNDPWFLTLYWVAAFAALVAAVYLLWRRGNAFMGREVRSSRRLRRWTAALMAAIVASHMWWCAIGTVWLADDRLVRNIVNIALDHMTLVPLTMAVLLTMLQDRRRPLWPWLVGEASVVLTAAMGLAGRDAFWGYEASYYCQLALIAAFIVYYVVAVRHYGRWLLDNFSDLQHKEVWQSQLFALVLFAIYELYTSNMGQPLREYLSQLLTLAIVAFLVWRVETLQELEG